MKITITQEFTTLADAEAFLAKLAAVPPKVSIAAPSLPQAIAEAQPTTETKKERKPRSDAGKPRGPYKTTEPNANAGAGSAPSDQSAATSSDQAGSAPAPTAPAPAAASETAAPTQAPSSKPGDAVAGNAGDRPLPSAAAAPTFDEAKAALKRINDTKGLGTPACIQHLQEFGVQKFSDLPKEKYALFIKQADEKIADHQAAKK